MPLQTGQILDGRYRIVKLIGQGGYGAVYRAWDMSLQRPCAVKENLDTSQEALRQFEHEALLLAEVRHPNLPRVIDHFSIAGQGQYLVMDFVDGQSLEELLAQRGGPLTEQEVLPWIEQVCSALSYLHARRPAIIHRDIKPDNIIITPDGRAMLVDFGISKVYDPHLRTTIGAKAVTPGYSPPEQYGDETTDARSDVYALGATVYTLLTGQKPPESVRRLAGSDTLPAPHYHNLQIAPRVEQATLKAMEIDTQKRFQNVDDFARALSGSERAATPPVVAQRQIPAWIWLIIAVLALGLIAAIIVALIGGGTPGATATPVAEVTTAASATSPVVVLATETPAPPSETATSSPTSTSTATDTPSPSPTVTPSPTPTETPTPSCPAVGGPFASAWSQAQDQIGCATGGALRDQVVEENFQGGKMFWRAPIDHAQALAVYNDGSWRIYYHEPHQEGDPDYPCADANTPALSPPTPRRGFGAMWCDIPELRSRLGNATDAERAYSGTMQAFDGGFMIGTDYGAIFIFYEDGRWERR
ncbi:MAG: serine/threonine protein kinase [Chloroflexota bacterium]|nr:MAG: serine/threonine protein kinase [Chloroflexota bacterium]